MEDAPPAEHLHVVRTGSVELLHGDQVVDVLEPGEAFGLASVLTGLAPAFTVRAREPTTSVLIPREAALLALGHPDGAAYVALSLRERLVRAGHTVHALPTLSTTRLGGLVARPPLFCAPTDTVTAAARAMTGAGVSAALVDGPDGLGIVTDADLRERVLAAGRAPDTPLEVAVRTPAHCAGADALAGEALVDLLDAGAHHVCVLEGGRPVGLLTAEEIVRTEHNPFVLRRELALARDAEQLAAVCRAGLPRLLAALVGAGLSAGDISRVLTVESDTATARLVDFALERRGPAPVAWAWLALGSVARRELTLASDQDNALAYADGGGPEADAHMAGFAADVNAGLAACGFGEDRAEVLARNPRWRMSAPAWQAVFRDCLEHPDRSRLVRAAVAFDFRHVAGGLEVEAPLTGVIREAPAHPDFVRRLARTATDVHVPTPADFRRTPFRRAAQTLDLKRGAALPIANLARFHALSHGVTISGTLDRLVAGEDLGALDGRTATALREAFLIVSRLRLEHHAACVRSGRPPADAIAPGELPPLAREELFSALRAVAEAQKRLSVYAPLGL